MAAFRDDVMAASLKAVERRPGRPERAAARGAVIASPPDREQAFASAKRRSVWVRFLRVAILVGGLGTVAAMIAIAIFNPFAAKMSSLSFAALSVDGTKITMDRPKLAGFRSDGQAYMLTAERALQDIRRPTIVELQKVDGEIGIAAGEATRVSADAGVYDSVAEHMDLSNNVRISDSRFNVQLRSASLDFKTGVYRSEEPVEVHVGEGTTIFGDRAIARNNGQELTFDGHVRTRIVPQGEPAASGKAKRIDP
jgi:lipopolysaccharide export system protein LptC